MKAKIITLNLKRNRQLHTTGHSLGRWGRFYRSWLPNDEVRYMTFEGQVMFVQDGTHQLVRCVPNSVMQGVLVKLDHRF